MKHPALRRLLIPLLCLLLVLAFAGGVLIYRQLIKRASAPVPSGQQAVTQPEDDALINAPFFLQINSSRHGVTGYLSYSVYFYNDMGNELLFTCGRWFLESETETIGWSGNEYDIAVVFTDGRTLTYVFDGADQWVD